MEMDIQQNEDEVIIVKIEEDQIVTFLPDDGFSELAFSALQKKTKNKEEGFFSVRHKDEYYFSNKPLTKELVLTILKEMEI